MSLPHISKTRCLVNQIAEPSERSVRLREEGSFQGKCYHFPFLFNESWELQQHYKWLSVQAITSFLQGSNGEPASAGAQSAPRPGYREQWRDYKWSLYKDLPGKDGDPGPLNGVQTKPSGNPSVTDPGNFWGPQNTGRHLKIEEEEKGEKLGSPLSWRARGGTVNKTDLLSERKDGQRWGVGEGGGNWLICKIKKNFK